MLFLDRVAGAHAIYQRKVCSLVSDRRAAASAWRASRYRGAIMRLTVGPLPPAVYWRRRAVVLGVLLSRDLLVARRVRGGEGRRAPTAGATWPTGTASPAAVTAALDPPHDRRQHHRQPDHPRAAAPRRPDPRRPAARPRVRRHRDAADRRWRRPRSPERRTSSSPSRSRTSAPVPAPGTSAPTRRSCTCERRRPRSGRRTPAADHGATYGVRARGRVLQLTWTAASNAGCANRRPPRHRQYAPSALLGTKVSGPAALPSVI